LSSSSAHIKGDDGKKNVIYSGSTSQVFLSFCKEQEGKSLSIENSLKVVRAIKVYCRMFERKSFLATKLSVYVREQLRMKNFLGSLALGGKFLEEKYFHFSKTRDVFRFFFGISSYETMETFPS
jgi:hypothetical protein